MSLRMIVGRANANKSSFILDEMKQKLRDNPTGKPIFYVVPEQMSFQQEYELLNDDIHGSVRAQIVSFSRLAWRVLQETGGSTRQFISSTGMQMMLRKIIQQRKEPFKVFQKAVEKQGFIEEIEGMITEFKRHCITPEYLEEQLKFTAGNISLTNKLDDLHYIYAHLMSQLENKYIDGEDQLTMLTEKIAHTPFFYNAEIYIDGFHRFTPKELGIIAELLKVTKRMSIALTLDSTTLETEQTELDLFFQTSETLAVLHEVAKDSNIPIETPVILQDELYTVMKHGALQHIETYFDDRPTPKYETTQSIPVTIAEAIHPRAELDGVIQQILTLVKNNHYRYQDMAIYVRDPETYNELIKTMFQDYGIPVFIDEKRTMLNHPFIEFVRSIFEVIQSNWRYEDVFRFLKTGLVPSTNEEFPLTIDAIDQLENYVLEYGKRSKTEWLADQDWKYQRFRGFDEAKQTDVEKKKELKINAYRHQVIEVLHPFAKLMKGKVSVQQRCEILYKTIVDLRVPFALEKRRDNYEQSGNIEKSREEEQVWNGVIQLLDEMVDMIGDEVMSLNQFKEILDAGLDALQFAHVPPTMDHVIVGSIDHSRIGPKKIVFLLGVNEGFWPMKPPIDGVINEQEREFLKQFGMQLAASNRRTLLDDNFYMYLAFSSAIDELHVSYRLSNHEGKANTPSPMIQRLYEFFPTFGDPILLQDPDELKEASRFITTPKKTRAALTSQLARYIRGYPVESVWWNVLNWYMTHETAFETTNRVLQSLFYENKPIHLSKKTVEKLYPQQLKASVSRLEMLYNCSYQHFAQYSLGLEERRTYTLAAPDIGQLFHEALKMITRWTQEGLDGVPNKMLGTLTKADANQFAEKAMNDLAPYLQHKILSSSSRYRYIQQKLQKIIAQATYILSEQSRVSNFSPIGVELGFGLDKEKSGGLDAMRIPLHGNYEIVLRGRIDRVDQFLQNDQLYLRIIDYKSSARGLDLIDVYYGLALQMLTYLDVVLTQSAKWLNKEKDAEPAGVLYFHLHQPLIKDAYSLTDEQIEQEILKQFKMKGLLTSDLDVVTQMDTSIQSGRSHVVPFGLKKDETFYAGSKVVETETFTMLRHYMHHLIADAGLQILSGKVDINPYEKDGFHACQFCSFKSVCQFDPLLRENNYRKLVPMDEEKILEKIKESTEIHKK